MRRLLFLLVAMSVTTVFAQSVSPKDPYQKTHIQNMHYKPDVAVQSKLRNAQEWKNFTNQHGNWWVEFNESTGMPRRSYGTPIILSGATPEEMALNFLSTEMKSYYSANNNLKLLKVNTSDKYNYVNFIQQYNGLDILWSNATFRLTLDSKLVMFGLDTYNNVSVNTTPGVSEEAIKTYASADFSITVNSVQVEPALKILPLMQGEAGTYIYKLVYEAIVSTTDNNNLPGLYYSVIDANTGEVYYRQNRVHACGAYLMSASLQANSDISFNPLSATENKGLPYLKLTIAGDDYYTDANGFINLNFITEPTDANVKLDGLYAKVYQGASGSSLESIDITLEPGENIIEFDDLSGALTSEVSAYYHQNIVHDKMKTYWPDFTDLDFNQLIRVERTDGSCNAFYDGTSTNFYAEGGGCPSTALFDDVVMHEYGHGINYDAYDWLGGTWNNGALGEAYADLWGIAVTEYPIVGQGFSGGADTYVRKYDGDPKVYPQDLVGEVHADGEIIAGAWWDVAENFGGDVQAMVDLWIQTWDATPMRPDGQEGLLYGDILLEALLADDDNFDLTDGTPRYAEINAAFCEHGITLLGEVFVDHTPYTTPVEAEVEVVINADFDVSDIDYLGEVTMYYRELPYFTWNMVPMVNTSGTNYSGVIPAKPIGTILAYYFTVTDNGSCAAATLPLKADLPSEPNLPFYALVGYNLLHTEDFDITFGAWDINPFGTDEAVTGTWDVNEPTASVDATGYQVQTDKDHTAGSSNLCAFTGNASIGAGVGDNDVDDGQTTLRTPIFDMSEYDDPAITYWRHYSNASPTSANPGNDVWQVRITNDMDTWVTVERTHTEDNTWRMNAIRVKDYVEPTSTVAIIFIAQDSTIIGETLDGGSLVEAAIDDLQIWDIGEAPVDTTDTTGNSIAEIETLINGIFPNPANAYMHLYFGNVNAEMTITIFNQLGENMLSETVQATEGKRYTINTSAFASGVYTINCKTASGYINKRFVVNH